MLKKIKKFILSDNCIKLLIISITLFIGARAITGYLNANTTPVDLAQRRAIYAICEYCNAEGVHSFYINSDWSEQESLEYTACVDCIARGLKRL
jgi:hypothetical protein